MTLKQIIIKNLPAKRNILLKEIQNNDYGLTDREMRKTVEDMIKKDGFCIVSSRNGYSLIKTEAELEKARLYLKKKALSIFERYNSLKKNFEKMNPDKKQFELFD